MELALYSFLLVIDLFTAKLKVPYRGDYVLLI